jgi:uncharacterized oligopeptide transporter (OPT) family protein
LLAIGAGFGVALLLCGARAPMLVAVGMYLPFDTSSAIFVGGLLQWMVSRRTRNAGDAEKAKVEERGTLLASGLIAGEAIMGILLAVTFVAGIPSFTRLLTGADSFGFYGEWGGPLSVIAFAAIAWVLVWLPTRTAS